MTANWRTSFFLGLIAMQAPAHAAEPILVPTFTYASDDQFAVTVMLDNLVSDKLLSDGHIVLDADTVAPVVGEAAVSRCADTPGCPENILGSLPCRVAVVVNVRNQGGVLAGHVALYQEGMPAPVEEQDFPVVPGNEHMFAHDVSIMVAGLLGRLGPGSDVMLMDAARLIAGEPLPVAPAPVLAPAPVAPPVVLNLDDDLEEPTAPPMEPTPPTNRSSTGKLPEGVAQRHLLGSEAHFRKSGLDARDWIYRAMPHAGRVTIEVRAGLGLGDIDRQADVRVELSEGKQLDDGWYQEGPKSARRPRGGVFIGYAPLTFLDVGLLGGVQYSARRLTTGYTRTNEGEVSDSQVSDPQNIQAVAVFLQPRIRGYLAPVGPAKPFLFTGAEFRFFDAYNIEQPASVEYPIPQGGTIPGWTGGGGIIIDPGPIVGFLFEASYILHAGARSKPMVFGSWANRTPDLAVGTGGSVGLVGAVQFRL
jgi:hypothetical protein